MAPFLLCILAPEARTEVWSTPRGGWGTELNPEGTYPRWLEGKRWLGKKTQCCSWENGTQIPSLEDKDERWESKQ